MVLASDGDVSRDESVVGLQFLLPPTLRPVASRAGTSDTSCSLRCSLSALGGWLCGTTAATATGTTTATGSPL